MAETLPASSVHFPSCRDIQLGLAAYARSHVSLTQARWIHRHLRRCVGCRSVLDGYRAFALSRKRSLGRAFLLLETLSIAAVLLLFLYVGIDPQPLRAAPLPPQAASGPLLYSTWKPGTAYHIRIYVEDMAAAELSAEKILRRAALLRVRGPYGSRYFITARAGQLSALMQELGPLGGILAAPVGRRRWWVEDSTDPDACLATVDLLPAQTAAILSSA